MRLIEFPAGSGRTATYTPGEVAVVRAVIDAAEKAGDDALRQAVVLHDLKVEFGVDLTETEEP